MENMKISEGEFNTYLAAIAIANLCSKKYELYNSGSYDDEDPCFGTLDEINYNFVKYYDEKTETLDLSQFPMDIEMSLYGLSKICLRSSEAILSLIDTLNTKLLEEDLALCIKKKNSSRKRKLLNRQLILMEWLINDIYLIIDHFDKYDIDTNQDDETLDNVFLFSKKTSKSKMKSQYQYYEIIYDHKNCFKNEKNKYLTTNSYFEEEGK